MNLGKIAIDDRNWVMEVRNPDFWSFELLPVYVSENHKKSDWILDSPLAENSSFLTMCPCYGYLWLLLCCDRFIIYAIEVWALSSITTVEQLPSLILKLNLFIKTFEILPCRILAPTCNHLATGATCSCCHGHIVMCL